MMIQSDELIFFSEVGINNHYPTIKNSDFPVRYVNVYQAGYDDLFVLKDW